MFSLRTDCPYSRQKTDSKRSKCNFMTLLENDPLHFYETPLKKNNLTNILINQFKDSLL